MAVAKKEGVDGKSERLARLAALKQKRKDVARLNKQAIYQEQRNQKVASINRDKSPSDDKPITEDEVLDQRRKNLNYTLEDCEKWDAKQQRAKLARHEGGYQNFNHLAHQTYNKNVQELGVDQKAYDAQKEDLKQKHAVSDEKPLGIVDFTNKPTKEVTEKLAHDIATKSRERMQKRRTGDAAASSYINEKNKQFNMKLDRQYTNK